MVVVRMLNRVIYAIPIAVVYILVDKYVDKRYLAVKIAAAGEAVANAFDRVLAIMDTREGIVLGMVFLAIGIVLAMYFPRPTSQGSSRK